MSEIGAVRIEMKLTLPHPVTVFGISIDGVQPLFLVRKFLHVPDRNILSKICSERLSDADSYWINQLNSNEITFNPIFTAAEGVNRRTPTRQEFIDQYFVSQEKISRHLPLVSFTPHTEESISQSYALIDEISEKRLRESSFLIESAPLVASRSADSQLLAVENKIFLLAKKYGIAGPVLPLLAILSCLYESADGSTSAGRGVLHPKVNCSLNDAHNSLSDLLAIELLLASASLGIGHNVFITGEFNHQLQQLCNEL